MYYFSIVIFNSRDFFVLPIEMIASFGYKDLSRTERRVGAVIIYKLFCDGVVLAKGKTVRGFGESEGFARISDEFH